MYEYKAKLIKVVDGDTVDVDIDLGFGVWMKKQRIRMYGIDTPENNVLRDAYNNSLYFPITKEDNLSGQKRYEYNV